MRSSASFQLVGKTFIIFVHIHALDRCRREKVKASDRQMARGRADSSSRHADARSRCFKMTKTERQNLLPRVESKGSARKKREAENAREKTSSGRSAREERRGKHAIGEEGG